MQNDADYFTLLRATAILYDIYITYMRYLHIYIYKYVHYSIDVLCFKKIFFSDVSHQGVPCCEKPQVSRCCAKSLDDVGSSLWCWPYDVGRFLCQRGWPPKNGEQKMFVVFSWFSCVSNCLESRKNLKRTVDKDY